MASPETGLRRRSARPARFGRRRPTGEASPKAAGSRHGLAPLLARHHRRRARAVPASHRSAARGCAVHAETAMCSPLMPSAPAGARAVPLRRTRALMRHARPASPPAAAPQRRARPAGRPPALDPVVVTARGSRSRSPRCSPTSRSSAPTRSRAPACRASPSCCSGSPASRSCRTAAPAPVSGVFLRGANRGQTLVLIDGVRVGSSWAGSTTLEAIPLDQIDRIEMLRGPASSLYGADAIGGVVQVFTRRGTGAEFAGSGSAGYGTYRMGRQGRSVRAAWARCASRCRRRQASEGFNPIIEPANFRFNDDRDGYTNQNVSATSHAAPGRRTGAQCRSTSAVGSTSSSTAAPASTIGRSRRSRPGRWPAATAWRRSGCRNSSAGVGIDDSDTQTAFGDFPFDDHAAAIRVAERICAAAGNADGRRERREERVATDAGFATTARNTDSVFGIYQLRERRARAAGEPAPRRLRASTAARRPAPLSTAIATRRLRVTAGDSTGFKAPSFNDLYYPGFSNP